MAKKKPISENYLEKIPARKEGLPWKADEQGIVTVEVENKGFFCWISQKLFHRPRVSYIHLEVLGSFIWQAMDGKKDLFAIGAGLEAQFGEKAQPLYPRLAQYVKILEKYRFITFVKV